MPDRQQAWDLVCEYTKNISLRRHMLAVEAAMRAYARRFGENEETWGLVGLIHDFDYERHPAVATDGHPNAGAPILRACGYEEPVVRAVLSHATEVTGVDRRTLLEYTLYAVDELTGLITAVTLVRPSRDIGDVTVKSIKNKWKDKAFAAGVTRPDIEVGAATLGVDIWQHVGTVLGAMQEIAPDLGLGGTATP